MTVQRLKSLLGIMQKPGFQYKISIVFISFEIYVENIVRAALDFSKWLCDRVWVLVWNKMALEWNEIETYDV